MNLATKTAAEAYSELRSTHYLSEYEALTALRVAAEYGTFKNHGVEIICNDANEADPRYTIFKRES